MKDKGYLGDGVYAQHDGYQLWLSVEGGTEAPCYIALEPRVFKELIDYARRHGYAGS